MSPNFLLADGGLSLELSFDASWHERALSGDAQAIGMLADAAIEPLYTFCFYRLNRRPALCEDVVQETLLRAITDLGKYDPQRAKGQIFRWLIGLARNEIRRALAQEKNISSLETLWERMDKHLLKVYEQIDSGPFANEILEREETRQMVNTTMSQLPPQYRRALEEKYVHGRSVRDIAATLSTTEKAVESQLSRARRAFGDTFLALAENLGLEWGA